jgi:divalent metal cation (Fe/Co/Zn/Cd) transporter
VGGDLASSTGLPINSIAANQLHYADLAYLVGFVVAFAIFWIGARSMADRQVEPEAAAA